MVHIDLFSGIGGFAYAVDQVWDGAEHIFCEIDPFCQQVLKKHWKDSVIYGDIREFIADTESRESWKQTEREGWENTGRSCAERSAADTDKVRCVHGQSKEQSAEGYNKTQRESITGIEPPFLLTGGFPCQPFSQAGKRKGTADDRYLWKEMLRVIQLTKPTWIIAENVRGILTIEQGMVFEQVCLDLEGEGYEVQPFIIPAVAVNAPHRRDRVWFVAHKQRKGQQERQQQGNTEDSKKNQAGMDDRPERQDSNASDTERSSEQGFNDRPRQEQFRRSDWEQNWLTVASRICILDDGLPVELDGLKLTKSKHRVERLKALGNAIVPQVAVEIMQAIKQAE
jgi:DNA (cytosine-5)-methyltransferase 1